MQTEAAEEQEQPRAASSPRPDRAPDKRGVAPMTASERVAALQSPATGKASPRPTPEALGLYEGPKGLRAAVAERQSPPYSERPGLLVAELPKLLASRCNLRLWANTTGLSEEELISEVRLGLLRKSWMVGSQWDPSRSSYTLWTIMAAKSLLSHAFRAKRLQSRLEAPMPVVCLSRGQFGVEPQYEFGEDSATEVNLEARLQEWASDCLDAMYAEEVEAWLANIEDHGKPSKPGRRNGRRSAAESTAEAVAAWREALQAILGGKGVPLAAHGQGKMRWTVFQRWMEEQGCQPYKYDLPF